MRPFREKGGFLTCPAIPMRLMTRAAEYALFDLSTVAKSDYLLGEEPAEKAWSILTKSFPTGWYKPIRPVQPGMRWISIT